MSIKRYPFESSDNLIQEDFLIERIFSWYWKCPYENVVMLFSKEDYDEWYNMLVSGQTFERDKFQPGQTVTVGGKEYVLNEHKGIDIEYGAEVYWGVK